MSALAGLRVGVVFGDGLVGREREREGMLLLSVGAVVVSGAVSVIVDICAFFPFLLKVG